MVVNEEVSFGSLAIIPGQKAGLDDSFSNR